MWIHSIIVLLALLPDRVSSEGATYALGFMNITTDTKEVGFIQMMIVSVNVTYARVQAVAGTGYDDFKQISTTAGNFLNATLPYSRLTLTSEFQLNMPDIKKLAILVSTSEDCNVFGVKSDRGTTGAFMALPLTTTSTEFFIAGWPCTNELFFSAFQVVSAANDTCIEIYVINNGTYQRKNTHLLHEFDLLTYVVNVDNGNGPVSDYDPTGYYVNSSKPIAIYSGHSCAFVPNKYIPFCDHMIEQIPPVDELGTDHVVPPIVGRLDRAGYMVRVVATKGGTVVDWRSPNGDVAGSAVLSAGQFSEIWSPRSSQPIRVTCSVRCLVMQYNSGQYSPSGKNGDVPSDPYMSLVTPIERFDDSVALSTANFCDDLNQMVNFSNHVVIVVRKDSTQNVVVDGQRAPALMWATYWDTFAITAVNVSHGYHVVSSVPLGSAMFAVYVYGHSIVRGSSSAYGFTAAFKVAGTLINRSWLASKALLQQIEKKSLNDSCEQDRIYTGSLISSLKARYNQRIVNYTISLYVSPVSMSISKMSEQCRTAYNAEVTSQLVNVARIVNGRICRKQMCPYIAGSAGGGVPLNKSNTGAIGDDFVMFVAIDVGKLSSAVSFDYSETTGVVTGIHIDIQYVGVTETTSTTYSQCRAEIRDFLLEFKNWPLGGDLVSDLSTNNCGKMSFQTQRFAVGQLVCPAI